MGVTLCLISAGESIYDFAIHDNSDVGIFVLMAYPIYNGLFDSFPILVISLIFAVYGALIDMFDYFPQARQSYGHAAWKRSDLRVSSRKDFTNSSDHLGISYNRRLQPTPALLSRTNSKSLLPWSLHQELIDTLDDILTTFSEAMSPLIAVLMPACCSALMILFFETIVRDFADSDADSLYVVTVIMYFVWLSIALASCYTVEIQVRSMIPQSSSKSFHILARESSFRG